MNRYLADIEYPNINNQAYAFLTIQKIAQLNNSIILLIWNYENFKIIFL